MRFRLTAASTSERGQHLVAGRQVESAADGVCDGASRGDVHAVDDQGRGREVAHEHLHGAGVLDLRLTFL